METPREYLFSTFARWGVSNKELAKLVVKRTAVAGGKSALEQIETRSSLSRFVVHVQPGDYVYGWLDPFDQSVMRVVSRLNALPLPNVQEPFVMQLKTTVKEGMRQAFDECGLDGSLYANAVDRMAASSSASRADELELLVTLFVVAGCTGDPRQAVEYTMDKARRYLDAKSLATSLSDTYEASSSGNVTCLGIYRIENDVVMSNPYRLATDEAGTEIGSMSTSEHAINDVGYGVSRRHARIWRDVQGLWWIEGLGSTNGTVHISGSTGQQTVVEPPRRERGSGDVPVVVELHPGDRVVLAGTTEFAVVSLPAER